MYRTNSPRTDRLRNWVVKAERDMIALGLSRSPDGPFFFQHGLSRLFGRF